MNPDTIRDYLQRTAMDEAQAEALSRIFAEMATRSDLLILEKNVDSRGLSLEGKIDVLSRLPRREDLVRSSSFEEKIDVRFRAFEERIEHRFVALEEKFTGQMARLQADLTWKMIAIVGFFGTVITILNAFIG